MFPQRYPIRIDRLEHLALLDASRRAIDESWELVRALPPESAEIRAKPARRALELAARPSLKPRRGGCAYW